MKITSIAQKSSNKYVVIIDDKKYELYDDIIIKYQLYNKQEIDDKSFKLLLEDQNFYTAYYKMISFISYKMRTEQEIRNKLRSYHLGNNIINSIIDKLKENNYLNKEIYLNSYFHDQLSLSLNGPEKIKYDLKKIGYNDSEIDILLDNIDDETWLKRMDKIVNKKLKANHTLSCKMFNIKIRQHLKQLGYNNYLVDKLDTIEFDDSTIMKKNYDKFYKLYHKKYSDIELEKVINDKLYQQGFIKKEF